MADGGCGCDGLGDRVGMSGNGHGHRAAEVRLFTAPTPTVCRRTVCLFSANRQQVAIANNDALAPGGQLNCKKITRLL